MFHFCLGQAIGYTVNLLSIVCYSRKYPCPSYGRSLKIPRRLGSENQKFKGKYEAKLQFLAEWGGSNQTNPLWGGYGYFLKERILRSSLVSKQTVHQKIKLIRSAILPVVAFALILRMILSNFFIQILRLPPILG